MRFPCDRQTFGKVFYLFFYLDAKEPKDQDLKLLRYKLSQRLKSLNLRGLAIGFLIQYCSRASDIKLFFCGLPFQFA